MRFLAALLFLLAACAETPPPTAKIQTPVLAPDAMIAGDGARLPLRQWLPDGRPKAVIAALHGFNDYSNAFDLPAPTLTAAGIAVYAYDQRGFGRAPRVGRWVGEAVLHEDLVSFLSLLAERYPGVPLYVLGESMGAAVAMTTPDLPKLAGLILVAPAVWSRDEMPWYQDAALWLGDHLVPWVTLTGRGLHIQASDNIEMLRKLSLDPLVIKETRIGTIKGLCDLMDDASQAPLKTDLRTLVLFGQHDEVVPPDASNALLARLPGTVEQRTYPHGYHMLLRDLHADQPLGDIVAWIKP
jgi:acylglycerol lipase